MTSSTSAAVSPPPASAWDFACPDWFERLQNGRSLVPDLPLDEKEAARAVEIFNRLRLPDVTDQPEMRVGAGEWFRDIVRALFGSVDADGVRHVSELFGLVPKKQSKTTGGAGMMVTALLLNRRPRARMLLVGPTQEIADLAFQQASGMIEADPYLRTRFQIRDHVKTIVDRTNGAQLKIKTFDLKVMTGTPPVIVLLDELHIMAKNKNAARIIGQIRGGMITNPESLLIMITTQSDEPPSGVFKDELDFARKVRDGKITGSHVRMLPVLYEFPPEIQTSKDKRWQDPKIWPWVLPNLGLSVRLDRLVAEYQTATEKGEAEIRRWASQHLNVEIGMAIRSDSWSGADNWLDCADKTLTIEEMIRRCEVLVLGADNGGSDDLFGLTVGGREKGTSKWLFASRAWALRKVLDLRKEIAPKLEQFEAEGSLFIRNRGSEILADICEIVARIDKAQLFPKEAAMGVDTGHLGVLVDELAKIKMEPPRLVGVNPQGWSMNSAIESVDWKLVDGEMAHDGSAMMTWCVGNAKTVRQKNMLLITKEVSGAAKIDPLISLLICAKLLEANPVAVRRPKPSLLFI